MAAILDKLLGREVPPLVYSFDSFTVVAKLALLSLFPSGTKISFATNGAISYQEPGLKVGLDRMGLGASRGDLHLLVTPVYKALVVQPPVPKTPIGKIWECAKAGLESLQKTYLLEGESNTTKLLEAMIEKVSAALLAPLTPSGEALPSWWKQPAVAVVAALLKEGSEQKETLLSFLHVQDKRFQQLPAS